VRRCLLQRAQALGWTYRSDPPFTLERGSMIVRKLPAPGALLGALLLAVSVSALTLPRPALAEPGTSGEASLGVENEKALQTFREGIAAFDRRDFEAARVAFLQTFALKPTAPVVRRNLGLAEIYSGHYVEGARRLGRVIHTTDEGSAVDRARMVESLKKAEAHLERVTVEVNVEGAEIRMGDVELGVSPMPFAWYLEPGEYEVRITKPGFVAFTETRMARAGSAEHLRVHLKPLVVEEPVPVAAAPAPEPLPMEEGRQGPNPWLLVAGSAVTAGGLATGLMLTLFAADNADEVDRIGDSLVGVGCETSPRDACQELADAAAAHDRQVRWARVSFTVGAVAGVSTIVYALLASSDGEPSAASALHEPVLGVALESGGGRLVLDGRF
jgi:PEGA domain